MRVTVRPASRAVVFSNGDGFAFVSRSGSIVGFRGDVCDSTYIICKKVEGLRPGVRLYRNVNAAFEREIEARSPRREISADIDVRVSGAFVIELTATAEDGRSVTSRFNADVDKAENRERAEAMLREQLGKRSGVYAFRVRSLDAPGALPLLSASTINSMRRLLADDLSIQPAVGMSAKCEVSGTSSTPAGKKIQSPLMRTKYCIKYELGMCPRYQKAPQSRPLFLINNGRRLALGFDCARCEMTVDKTT
jgi:putative protease